MSRTLKRKLLSGNSTIIIMSYKSNKGERRVSQQQQKKSRCRVLGNLPWTLLISFFLHVAISKDLNSEEKEKERTHKSRNCKIINSNLIPFSSHKHAHCAFHGMPFVVTAHIALSLLCSGAVKSNFVKTKKYLISVCYRNNKKESIVEGLRSFAGRKD
jgi:hypothetical protein